MRTLASLMFVAWCCVGDPSVAADAPGGGGPAPLYTNHFNQAEAGSLSNDFLVLNGEFAVGKEGEEGWLELPGTPLDTYGLLLGPTFSPKADSGVIVQAEFQASARGRRLPAFGVGACGAGGYRLQVTPAKQQLELFRGENVLAAGPLAWKTGEWTALLLKVSRADQTWLIQGKIWSRGQPPPTSWQVEHTDKEEPFAGRASVWGLPFSGQPIRFDNLGVAKVEAK